MRVFVRDQPDQISRLVTRHYATVLLDDLSRELSEHDSVRKLATLQTPTLQESLYVARLEGEQIVSDQSRWTVVGNPQTQPLELGNISLALRTPRGLDSSQSLLLDRVQFTATGGVELRPSTATNTYWFGFSANSQSSSGSPGTQRLFRFQIPPAPGAKLIIATPRNVELKSPGVVVQKVAGLHEVLPGDWPGSTPTPSTGASQWWLVHLSGVSRFELQATEVSSSRLTDYAHLVRSARIDYIGSERLLQAHARFVVAGAPSASALRFRLAPELKIESVTVDDLPVEWQAQPNSVEASNMIELLHLPVSTQDRTIALKASCALELTGQVDLPAISIDESFVLDGICCMAGTNDVVADQLNAGTASVQRITPADVSEDTQQFTAETTPLLWQTRWLGSPPAMTATFSELRHTWHARSLTRLSLQSEWLSATCRMRLESSALTSNEIRLPIGSGWFIDAVRLIQKGSDFRARVEDRKGAANPVVVIYWEEDREQLGLELEVVAHSPRQLPADTVSVDVSRLVTLPGADQIDNYVVEPSNRFAVQMRPELLAYQRSAVDLPAWQQQLLPEQSEHWIFQGVRGQLPAITLATSNGTFSSQVVTVVRKVDAALSLETHITVTPHGGAIDHILLLPASSEAMHNRWTLHQIGNSADPSNISASSAPNVTLPITLPQRQLPAQLELSDDQSHLIELELPSALSSPFVLRAQTRVRQPADESFTTIPIVGVPQATSAESLVVLPSDLAARLHGKVELLAKAQTLNDRKLPEMLDQLSGTNNSRWVTARVDSATQQLLQIDLREIDKHSNWVWSESIEHTLMETGTVRHEARWLVEVTEQVPFQIQLPEGWRLEQVSVDGQSLASSATSSRLLLDMPPGPTAEVYLRCSSRRQAVPGWLSHSYLPRPELSSPILESRQTLALPPSRMRVPTFPFASASPAEDSRLIDRLLPQAAWNLLAPVGPGELVSTQQSKPAGQGLQTDMPAGWQRIEISDIDGSGAAGIGVWTISRAALAALGLACVVMTATLFWMSIGGAIRTWWLMIAACAVSLVLVPMWLLPVLQLLSLSLLLAAFLRLGCVVCRLRESAGNSRGRSSVVSGLRHAPTTSLLILVCLGAGAHGQNETTTPPSASTTTGPVADSVSSSPATKGAAQTNAANSGMSSVSNAISSPEDSDQTQEIFSVLIPIDESGEVSGAYAYAPTRLLELLAGGRQGTSRPEAPRLLSADYTLRMRHSVLGQPDQLQELAVEFRVQATHAEVEIRLPFNSNQLLLQRGSLAGQELSVGGRGLYQVGDAVVFRPTTVGAARLQLQFEARAVTVQENQAHLQCAVPPIPNATLRIVADSNSSFEVRTSGNGRKAVAPGATELLGPVDMLDLQWTLAKPRSTVGQASVEVNADTWLQARGDQLAAVCQLRIEQALSLPRELHVVAEPGWEPVGIDWQDAKLIANERSSLGDRRVYTLRCNDGWDSQSRRVLRVLMVARTDAHSDSGNDALSVPFLSLREVSQQTITRTLAWSAEPDATWLPEGLDFWQELPEVPGLQWGGLGWTLQPRLYRIANSLSATLRRVPASPPPRVEEINEIHLGEFETRLNYRAQLAVPSQRVLSMLIPADARVDAVRVDGKPANFRVTESSEHALIELLPGENPASVRAIEADLSLAMELGRDIPIPRVVLRDLEAASSIVRLLRGVDLDCQIGSNPTLQLQSASLPPHQLLPLLESPVGQFELRNAYRDIPRLPLNFQLHRRPNPPLIGAVMALQPVEQGWQATLRASWQTSEYPLDFAFFDLPAGIRDSVDTKRLASQIVPHGDASRVTLRLLPPPSVAGVTTVEFSFSLPHNGTTQAMSMPSLSVLAEHPVHPLIALPEQLNGQVIHWAQAGRRLADLPESLIADEWREGYQFYELDASQLQVSWKRFEDAPQSSVLYLSRATLLKHEPKWISGFVDYWLRPSGQVNLELSVADSCEVLGVEIGGRSGVWQRDGQKLSVLLQPNFLPVHVRVLVHWRVDAGQRSSLTLPLVLNATSDADALGYIDNQLAIQRVKVEDPLAIADSQHPRLLQRWGEVILDAWPRVSNRPVDQTQAWLLAWHPRVLELDDTQAIGSLLTSDKLQGLDVNNPDELNSLSASELWQRLWLQSQLRETNLSRASNAAAPSELAAKQAVDEYKEGEQANIAPIPSDELEQQARRESQWARRVSHQLLSYDGMLGGMSHGAGRPMVLELEVPPADTSFSAQLSAAGLLSAAALLVLWLANRFSAAYMRLLAAQPWIYWLQLAALAWFLLPASWPSWVLALTAVTMLTNQYLETRRRNRLLSRV